MDEEGTCPSSMDLQTVKGTCPSTVREGPWIVPGARQWVGREALDMLKTGSMETTLNSVSMKDGQLTRTPTASDGFALYDKS